MIGQDFEICICPQRGMEIYLCYFPLKKSSKNKFIISLVISSSDNGCSISFWTTSKSSFMAAEARL